MNNGYRPAWESFKFGLSGGFSTFCNFRHSDDFDLISEFAKGLGLEINTEIDDTEFIYFVSRK